jgi:hypothetical protein
MRELCDTVTEGRMPGKWPFLSIYRGKDRLEQVYSAVMIALYRSGGTDPHMDMAASPAPAIGAEINGPGKAYFDSVVTDNMMDALIELSAELWTMKDRIMVLESVLATQGIDATRLVEAHVPTDDERAARKAAREAFIAQVFASFQRRPR